MEDNYFLVDIDWAAITGCNDGLAVCTIVLPCSAARTTNIYVHKKKVTWRLRTNYFFLAFGVWSYLANNNNNIMETNKKALPHVIAIDYV